MKTITKYRKFFNQASAYFMNPETNQAWLDKFEDRIKEANLDMGSKREILRYFEDMVNHRHETWKSAGSFMHAVITGNFTEAAFRADGNNRTQLGEYLRLWVDLARM